MAQQENAASLSRHQHSLAVKALARLLLAGITILLANLARAYDVEPDSFGNRIYILLDNPNAGAVYHSVSVSGTPPAFVSNISASIIPASIPGGRSRLAAVDFDVSTAAAGSSADLVLSVSATAAGQNATFNIPVPLTVSTTAPNAQGFVGSSEPAPDPDGADSDGDGTVDSLELAYGSDSADASSTPGQQSSLPSENVPTLMFTSYLVLAIVLLVIGAIPIVRSRGMIDEVNKRSLRSPPLASAIVIFATAAIVLTAEHSRAGNATRIQIVELLPELTSLSAEITGGTSVTATASSSGAAGGASAAIDGNAGTRWESQHGIDPSWLLLDLGTGYALESVTIYWEAANAATYEIQGSNDSSSWSTLATYSGGTFGDRTDNLLTSGNYRYLRMLGLTRSQGNNWGYSIYEMQVYGTLPLVSDADNDGVDDSRDDCPETPADTIVDADGCEPGSYGGYDAPTSYPGYSLVWSDEFNGNSVDLNNWTFETGNGCAQGICGWGNNELQNYTSQNTSVGNGVLIIEAREDNPGNYTSSRLKTQGKQFFQYGRIDIRAVLPAGTGFWPALWMLGESISTVGWPASGEIDIMEMRGNEPNKVLGTAHWQDGGGNHAYYSSENNWQGQDTSPVLPSGTFADEFHVFSIVWNSSSISWYLDDATQPFHVIDTTPSHTSELRGQFFLLMNIAVGGNFLPNPDASTVFPQSMIVDYVRVYQQP